VMNTLVRRQAGALRRWLKQMVSWHRPGHRLPHGCWWRWSPDTGGSSALCSARGAGSPPPAARTRWKRCVSTARCVARGLRCAGLAAAIRSTPAGSIRCHPPCTVADPVPREHVR